jgi:methyltransferase (TIGR00027 family)
MTTHVSLDTYGLGGVGDTARWMAASRARESRRPDRLFNDPLADPLAGPDGAGLLTYFHPNHASDDGNPFLPIRYRWFDDYLTASVKAGAQVVGLGAGLDTRAFRFPWPEGVTLYEVDQPAVLAYKQWRVEGTQPRCERVLVPVNLGEDWPNALTTSGFDPARPTIWFMEGVSFYLPQDLAQRVVKDIASLSAPGSRLALDIIGTGIFRFRYMKQFLQRLADADSPWVFGTDDPEGFVNSAGWHGARAVEPGHEEADFGRWSADWSPPGFPGLPRFYLVTAER